MINERLRCPSCFNTRNISVTGHDIDYIYDMECECLECGCTDDYEYFKIDENNMLYQIKIEDNGEPQLYFGYDEDSMISMADYFSFIANVLAGNYTVTYNDDEYEY